MRNKTVTKRSFAAFLAAALLCLSALCAPAPPAAAAKAGVQGFVYEAVRSNRIAGAKATLYPASGEGQESTVYTDGDGAFSWDVPTGNCTVGIELPDHKPATAVCSGGTLAIPVVTTEAPEIAAVIEKEDCICVAFTQYMDLGTVNESTLVFSKNGVRVSGERWEADRERSGAQAGVYYASAFNFTPDREITEITVRGVKNYAGIAMKGERRISVADAISETYFHPGDVNGDAAVTAADARLALRAAVGLFTDEEKTYDFGAGSNAFLTADCDRNGTISAADARLILRAAVGLHTFYSDSPLTDYKNLTEKRNTRTRPIDRITIHHMSGVMTARECCDYFCNSDRDVSANYCVGWDGSVALNVEEQYRAWTSSSEENDMRAVTIEVSNDGYGPDWHVSDAALKKLIALCVDICRRNHIRELVYTEDAHGNLTMHRMFIATGCPGPYLGGKFPYIAEQVNRALAGEKE